LIGERPLDLVQPVLSYITQDDACSGTVERLRDSQPDPG